jgi:hypothetical protein
MEFNSAFRGLISTLMMGTEHALETLGVSTSLRVLTFPKQFSVVAELHGIKHAAQTNGLRKCKSGGKYITK